MGPEVTHLARALQLGVRAAPSSHPTILQPAVQQHLARDMRAQARSNGPAAVSCHKRKHAALEGSNDTDCKLEKKCSKLISNVPRSGPALVQRLAQIAEAKSDR